MLSARISSSRWSASTTMLRNLSIVKDRPLMPTRSCRYSDRAGAGQPDGERDASSTGARSEQTQRGRAHRSTAPLTIRRQPSKRGCSTDSSGSPSNGRMCSRGPATSIRPGATSSSMPLPSSCQDSWRRYCDGGLARPRSPRRCRRRAGRPGRRRRPGPRPARRPAWPTRTRSAGVTHAADDLQAGVAAARPAVRPARAPRRPRPTTTTRLVHRPRTRSRRELLARGVPDQQGGQRQGGHGDHHQRPGEVEHGGVGDEAGERPAAGARPGRRVRYSSLPVPKTRSE